MGQVQLETCETPFYRISDWFGLNGKCFCYQCSQFAIVELQALAKIFSQLKITVTQ